jgi:hypothetical protein
MQMLPPSFGPVSTVFGNDSGDKLSHGISASFPILRIKGKVWSITRGSEEPVILMRPGNDGPRNSLDVVILAASQYVSKVWYEHGFEEGATAPPDCFSANGIVPDPSSTKKQCDTCAACPQGKWGSRITPQGKKAKACADSKRLAVAPLGDIRNEAFGGPMLLRVPAASLAALAQYGDGMSARGYEYYTIGTKIAFEATEAFPKLAFEPIRPLKDDEAQSVLELRDSEIVRSILQEREDGAFDLEAAKPVDKVTPKVTPLPSKPSPVSHVSQQATNSFGNAGGTVAANPAPKPAPKPAAPKKPVLETVPQSKGDPLPIPEEVTGDAFEDSLDAQIEGLMANE